MMRKQVYIDAEQERLLKRRAKALGVSESELIRRGILQAGRGGMVVRDSQAWEEELAFIRERARIQELGKKRGWTREELYEDRLDVG
ncbi:MAG TPA: hypothetical protein VNL15_06940 [Dehalococcoidia bacterium]|nr:hypothetical protein [Dehalococcoidia bacterium]